MRKVVVWIILVGCGTACSGGATSPPSVDSSVASSQISKVVDLSGHWSLLQEDCNFDVLPTIDVTPTDALDDLQTFKMISFNDTGNTIAITYSEGTLDKLGEISLCYSDSIESCAIRCVGTATTDNVVVLTCNNIPSGNCRLTLQK